MNAITYSQLLTKQNKHQNITLALGEIMNGTRTNFNQKESTDMKKISQTHLSSNVKISENALKEFEVARTEYLTELEALRAKYQKRFEDILDGGKE